MKRLILGFLLFLPILISAQKQHDCDQLAFEFRGITSENGKKQLILEVSNAIHTGTLYYYPGFVLIDEDGNEVAREQVTYYGIGNNFQIHKLDLLEKISYPFEGTLELHGSNYSKLFCSFPVELYKPEKVTTDIIRDEPIKIALNYSGDYIILDLGGVNINAEVEEFYLNVTNEMGEEIYKSNTDVGSFEIPTADLSGIGIYYFSIWDNVNKKLLPVQVIELE